jgi:hypothetical protein
VNFIITPCILLQLRFFDNGESLKIVLTFHELVTTSGRSTSRLNTGVLRRASAGAVGFLLGD